MLCQIGNPYFAIFNGNVNRFKGFRVSEASSIIAFIVKNNYLLAF
jgi:hypothetical protein